MADRYPSRNFDYYWDDGVPQGLISYLDRESIPHYEYSFSSYGKIYHGIMIDFPEDYDIFAVIEAAGNYDGIGSVICSGEWTT